MSEHRSFGARLRREPLVAFFALGALLFLLDRGRSDEGARPIVVDAAFVESLREEATRRTGHAPDATQTEALVATWVREEALFREAQAMALDRGDVIVRRRLVQKIELWLAAEEAPEEPSEAELEAYLATRSDDFVAPARTSVTLCFFSAELHDDALATAAAHLAVLRAGGEAACDPHLSGTSFRERTDAQLSASLGDAVTDAARTGGIGVWTEPIGTARGAYLVRVDARTPGGPRALAEVRDAVRDGWLEERRAERVAAREREIVARYEVERR